jgi:hypothetical protein|tara:strand:+ start:5180 stop:5809 length:630 start_codon:yes stop_codon:yes gene_type:complete
MSFWFVFALIAALAISLAVKLGLVNARHNDADDAALGGMFIAVFIAGSLSGISVFVSENVSSKTAFANETGVIASYDNSILLWQWNDVFEAEAFSYEERSIDIAATTRPITTNPSIHSVSYTVTVTTCGEPRVCWEALQAAKKTTSGTLEGVVRLHLNDLHAEDHAKFLAFTNSEVPAQQEKLNGLVRDFIEPRLPAGIKVTDVHFQTL